MIQKFPYEDPTYDKLQEDLEKIRGKFKQVCRIMLLLLHKMVLISENIESLNLLKPTVFVQSNYCSPFAITVKILELKILE